MNLFDSFRLREIEFRNRIAVSPMCQYSANDGVPNEWHLVHLGSRAVGGAALVIAEASAVEARGRISPADAGIYSGAQVEAWSKITSFIREQGAVAGIQLAHAGRKASTSVPWAASGPVGDVEGGWSPIVGPSAIPFSEGWQTPVELDESGIAEIVKAFKESAQRSLDAGFEVAEIHGAHGYLLHEFYSPLSNHRTDGYGGSFENRTRIVREVVSAVRSVWPERLPVFIRISASDWTEGGWDVEQAVRLAKDLKPMGVDLVDVSSGGNVPNAKIAIGPAYQTPFAAQIRAEAGIATGAVGLITEPKQAQEIVASGKADMILLARELLRDPYWPRRAAAELGREIAAPKQYLRAW
jgi:2,4-dienoyl-CoA reductase-like NADH-dependent reductase (Old Yellow Enzyme family)